jgi:glycerol-3-phosphate dehydrogenase
MFALPAGPVTILGTTETPAERGPDAVRANAADVAYLLEAANAFFPAARLCADDVVSAWAGIRPLAAATAGRAGAGTDAASREHAIVTDARGMVTVSGGKLTTYRAMAAEVVDACGALLGGIAGAADTARVALPGGELAGRPLADVARAAIAATGDADVGHRLARAHGARWPAVWALADPARGGDPALAARLTGALPYTGAELAYAVREEWACTLADLLVRRTPLAYETRDAGRAAARRAAAIVAPALGWDAARVTRELAAYDAEATRLFGIDA